MNKQKENRPALLVDFKKNRIRISKHTLHLLGDPDYIQLLVNPNTNTIAIRCTTGNDHLSHRIKWDELLQHKCCELYSRAFLHTLRSSSAQWEENKAYRIYGTVLSIHNLAEFPMKESIAIVPKEEYPNHE